MKPHLTLEQKKAWVALVFLGFQWSTIQNTCSQLTQRWHRPAIRGSVRQAWCSDGLVCSNGHSSTIKVIYSVTGTGLFVVCLISWRLNETGHFVFKTSLPGDAGGWVGEDDRQLRRNWKWNAYIPKQHQQHTLMCESPVGSSCSSTVSSRLRFLSPAKAFVKAFVNSSICNLCTCNPKHKDNITMVRVFIWYLLFQDMPCHVTIKFFLHFLLLCLCLRR